MSRRLVLMSQWKALTQSQQDTVLMLYEHQENGHGKSQPKINRGSIHALEDKGYVEYNPYRCEHCMSEIYRLTEYGWILAYFASNDWWVIDPNRYKNEQLIEDED